MSYKYKPLDQCIVETHRYSENARELNYNAYFVKMAEANRKHEKTNHCLRNATLRNSLKLHD